MSKSKSKPPESEETTVEAVAGEATTEPVCPVRAEYENVELTPDQERQLRIRSEVLGVSRDTYLSIFSHGANFIRLTA